MTAPFSDDLALSRKALGGSAQAQEVLVQRLRCIGRILNARNIRSGLRLPTHTLEDLAQEVALLVWRKLGDYAGQAPLEGWAAAFCVHALHNSIRSQQRLTAKVTELSTEPYTLPEQDIDGVTSAMHDCLNRLDKDDHAIVQAKHFDGLTLHEIAASSHQQISFVKSRYYRALLALRSCLGNRKESA